MAFKRFGLVRCFQSRWTRSAATFCVPHDGVPLKTQAISQLLITLSALPSEPFDMEPHNTDRRSSAALGCNRPRFGKRLRFKEVTQFR